MTKCVIEVVTESVTKSQSESVTETVIKLVTKSVTELVIDFKIWILDYESVTNIFSLILNFFLRKNINLVTLILR